jgi:hypothetical protein
VSSTSVLDGPAVLEEVSSSTAAQPVSQAPARLTEWQVMLLTSEPENVGAILAL